MAKGQQTKTNIIDTALHIATHHGLESLSIGGLAEATSMSKSGVFAHFGSREELQISVVREYHHRFEQEVFYPALQAEKGLPRLRAMFGNWMQRTTIELDSGCIYISGAVEFSEREGAVRDAQWKAASIHTYDDHRVAMCFSLAAFNPAGLPVRIEDPKCVAKTYPDYFEALFSLTQNSAVEVPVICVDGPTASGKGTLAAVVAKALGYHFLDSGSLYRVTALAAMQHGLALDATAEQGIVDLLKTLDIRFLEGRVWVNGVDVSDAIRTEEAGMNASKVSVLPAVRHALIDLQHRFRQLPGLVADGRDMGTVIFPDASLKVFLMASAEQRAERRYKQLISKGNSATLADLRADLEARDARDSSRVIAPLKPAQDARLLDNSDLTVEKSLELVLNWWQGQQPFKSV